MWNISLSALAAVALCSCKPHIQDNLKSLDGYGGLSFGSTFEESMSVVSPSAFNPLGLKECFEDMPITGCFLSPKDELAVFKQIQGIPYALQLEFNRLGALTDITLSYSRGNEWDDDNNLVQAKITKAQCADILERSIDWVSKEFGELTKGSRDKNETATTENGNLYWIGDASEKKGFESYGEVKMAGDRTVTVYSHYLLLDEFGPDCNVSVSFEDAVSVERRPADPESDALLKDE